MNLLAERQYELIFSVLEIEKLKKVWPPEKKELVFLSGLFDESLPEKFYVYGFNLDSNYAVHIFVRTPGKIIPTEKFSFSLGVKNDNFSLYFSAAEVVTTIPEGLYEWGMRVVGKDKSVLVPKRQVWRPERIGPPGREVPPPEVPEELLPRYIYMPSPPQLIPPSQGEEESFLEKMTEMLKKMPWYGWAGVGGMIILLLAVSSKGEKNERSSFL